MRRLPILLRAAARLAFDCCVCRGGYRIPIASATSSDARSRSLNSAAGRRGSAASGSSGEKINGRSHVAIRESAGVFATRPAREVRAGCRSEAHIGRRDGVSASGGASRTPVAAPSPASLSLTACTDATRSPAAVSGRDAAGGDGTLERRIAAFLLAGGSRVSHLVGTVRAVLTERVRTDGTWDKHMSGDECSSLIAEICRRDGGGKRSERAVEGVLMQCVCAARMPERALSLMQQLRARRAVTPIALAHLAGILSRSAVARSDADAVAVSVLPPDRELQVLGCVTEARRLQPQLDRITASLLLEAAAWTSRWRHFLPWTAAAESPALANGDEGPLLSEDEMSPEACRLMAIAAARDGFVPDACRLLALLSGRQSNAPPFVSALQGALLALVGDRDQKHDGLSTLLDSLCDLDGLRLPESTVRPALESACPPSWRVRVSEVDPASGRCNCCGRELERRELSADDVRRLSDAFVDASVVGSDAFLRSSPAEISSFRRHMDNGGRYDVVIDGLNVAGKRYIGRTSTDRLPPHNGKEFPFHRAQLAAVLSHFHAQKKKILVVGKPPIASLLSDQWKRRVDYFVVNSVSQDDLYVVYAALLSGPQCYVVSEDQYKDHKKHLPLALQRLFVAWQGSRQICFMRLEGSGSGCRPVFKMPATHHGNAQRTSKGWHLPLDNPQEASLTYNVTPSWLCIDVGTKQASSVSPATETVAMVDTADAGERRSIGS